jgi:FixJ family two-component response regulator
VPEIKPVVVVIEDDPSMLRALRRLIAGAGFEVQTFDRPSVLLQSDLPASDACLVADVHLPEMNGVQLCELLAATGRTLPVILITAHPDEQTRSMASRANPVAFLMKPFPRDLLLSAIGKALRAGKHA